ncbi:MAG: hypothetical protein NC416_05620 [Eubacterium sp.]|nr:hypothetical protein [Eubacterium sp.]
MQHYIKYSKNKIFISLTVILVFSVFIIIRECDYPLLVHSEIFKLFFVHKYTEKLFYNLSLSYIAAYIFYIIQIFIPQTIRNKRACKILAMEFQKEYRLTKEFLFLVSQITKMEGISKIQYKSSFSSFYYRDYSNNILKRFSEINTLEQLVQDIQQQFIAIENNKYYNELDSYIIEFYSLFPLTEIQKCLDCIIYSFNSTNNLNVVSNDLISPIEQFLIRMAYIMPWCTAVDISQCTDQLLIQKYDNAFENSGLNEFKFALRMKEKTDDINRPTHPIRGALEACKH